MSRLAGLGPPPDPLGLYTRFAEVHEAFLAAASRRDGEALEQAFLELYVHLHGHQAPYTGAERATLDRRGGYWSHAGGLAPVLKAPDWVGADTASIDLGAGNGLQLLLVQTLAPHRRTVQVEISSAMIEAGRALQRWLGIEDTRVEWWQADVASVSPAGFDFVYLYRPVRPDGPGRGFYEHVARELDSGPREVVVFSIADCLVDFLPPSFERFFFDGHLACFRRAVPGRGAGAAGRIAGLDAGKRTP